jgi:hypothetical protein
LWQLVLQLLDLTEEQLRHSKKDWFNVALEFGGSSRTLCATILQKAMTQVVPLDLKMLM